MSDFVSKLQMPTAVDEGTYFDLSTEHISTADFGQFSPVYRKEMVPGERIQINMETYTRLSPLFKPAFAQISIHNKAFFVPYRTIMPKWNEFIEDVQTSFINSNGASSFGHIDKVPIVTMETIVEFLTNSTMGTSNPVTDQAQINSGNYDIVARTAGSTTNSYHKLTAYGRQCLKILNSLGYNVNTQVDSQGQLDIEFSALPLLAMLKIYLDWYSNSQYSQISLCQELLNRQYSYTLYDTDLEQIFDEIAWIQYDQDYFTSAWDHPMGPNSGTESSITMPDIVTYNSSLNSAYKDSIGNRFGSNDLDASVGRVNMSGSVGSNGSTVSTSGVISQYMLDAIKHLQDYLKRHQLVGARVLDRFLARFGVTLPSEKLNRCNYLGSNNVNIRIGDIYSTADTTGTSGAGLGAYAGAGSGYDASGNFEFKTDEYGIMIVVSTIVPKIGYYQGYDANLRHVSRLDFWTPEFDGLGTRAIEFGELYTGIHNPTATSVLTDVFGFTPRYSEYKRALSTVSGDYRVHTTSSDYNDSWHTLRKFDGPISPFTTGGMNSYTKHGRPFCSMNLDAEQYNRVFAGYLDSDGYIKNNDFFNMLYLFNVADYAPMCSLYDGYDFESDGKKITSTINGTQMN